MADLESAHFGYLGLILTHGLSAYTLWPTNHYNLCLLVCVCVQNFSVLRILHSTLNSTMFYVVIYVKDSLFVEKEVTDEGAEPGWWRRSVHPPVG